MKTNCINNYTNFNGLIKLKNTKNNTTKNIAINTEFVTDVSNFPKDKYKENTYDTTNNSYICMQDGTCYNVKKPYPEVLKAYTVALGSDDVVSDLNCEFAEI